MTAVRWLLESASVRLRDVVAAIPRDGWIGRPDRSRWDIAVAVGLDATLDPVLVAELWALVEPHVATMRATGPTVPGPRPNSAPMPVRGIGCSTRSAGDRAGRGLAPGWPIEVGGG